MTKNNNSTNYNGVFVKFGVPDKLKQELQKLASERNIGLSALLRLISSEYVKRTKEI